MIYRNKYHLTRITQVMTFVVAFYAIGQIIAAGLNGKSLVPPALLLFGSIAIGVTASLLSYYYRSRQDDTTRSQKVAVEALAWLGQSKKKSKSS